MIASAMSSRGKGASATRGIIVNDERRATRAIRSRRAGWRQNKIASTTKLRNNAVDTVASKRMRLMRSSQTHMRRASSKNLPRKQQSRWMSA